MLHPAKRYARVEKPAADRALVNLSVLKFSLSRPLRRVEFEDDDPLSS